MRKLHELLAVEGDLKSKALAEVNRIKGLFSSGAERLVGQVRTYEPLEEGDLSFDSEIIELSTTVADELARLRHVFGRWTDAAAQKEITNTSTSADIVIDEKVFLTGLPAPALLNLEAKLANLRGVYDAIPTNDPAVRWEQDDNLGYYVSPVRHQHRTEKRQQALVLYEATPEHPAQAQLITKDTVVGTISTTIHSGMLSVIEKCDLLDRLDKMAQAVKEARQRANNTDVSVANIADIVFNYIHGE